MKLLRFIFNLSTTFVAALVGVWVGGQARSQLTGRPAWTLYSEFQDKQGHIVRNVPVVTKFYPALLFSLVGRPRWVFALLGGLLAGALIDDSIEMLWIDLVLHSALKTTQPQSGSTE